MYQLDFYTVFLVSTAPVSGQFYSVVGPVIWPWRCFSCGWNRSQAHRWFSTGQRAVPVIILYETILICRESCLEVRCGPESKPSHCSICWLKHSSPGEEFCNAAEFGTVLHTIAQYRTFQSCKLPFQGSAKAAAIRTALYLTRMSHICQEKIIKLAF